MWIYSFASKLELVLYRAEWVVLLKRTVSLRFCASLQYSLSRISASETQSQ